ncbi:unnamed protein product [Schistocephalus solidus]|uniref:MORN repeat-containing protein 3 n=1 Tax=Schistocephalus solidus TaxID=70667 RepID=A0A183T204_SCHSO|nr:unnamed protein product [Schistocephalus solidus]
MNKSKCNKAKSFVEENIEKAKTNGLRCTIYSVNGDQYTGEWKNNKKHGQWKFGKRSGFGVLSVVGPDGKHIKIYSGSWKNDKRHGFGENWYSDDEFYEGEWYADKRYGWGRQYYKDGSMYEGEWVDDVRCGDGMLRMPNENRYEGSWVNDKKNGKGKFIFHKTSQVMEGVWVDDIARCAQIIDLGGRSEPTSTTYPIPEVRRYCKTFISY